METALLNLAIDSRNNTKEKVFCSEIQFFFLTSRKNRSESELLNTGVMTHWRDIYIDYLNTWGLFLFVFLQTPNQCLFARRECHFWMFSVWQYFCSSPLNLACVSLSPGSLERRWKNSCNCHSGTTTNSAIVITQLITMLLDGDSIFLWMQSSSVWEKTAGVNTQNTHKEYFETPS